MLLDITHSLIVQNIDPTVTEICFNSEPIVANFISDQTIGAGKTTSFQFNVDTFHDPDGDTLTYSATLSNGNSLSDWVTFVSTTRTFNFDPTSGNYGVISIKVIATDKHGGTVSNIFDVTVLKETPISDITEENAPPTVKTPDQTIYVEETPVSYVTEENAPPIVNNHIHGQIIYTGEATSFQFGSKAFYDSDGDELAYSATLSDDSSLPEWITFNPSTRTFNFNPMSSNQGKINLKVAADDGKGGVIFDMFTVTILKTPEPEPEPNKNPIVANAIPDQEVEIGTVGIFPFNNNTFYDPDGDNLTYSVTLPNEHPLPDWITFEWSEREDAHVFIFTPTA